jgi:hypothetical protein
MPARGTLSACPRAEFGVADAAQDWGRPMRLLSITWADGKEASQTAEVNSQVCGRDDPVGRCAASCCGLMPARTAGDQSSWKCRSCCWRCGERPCTTLAPARRSCGGGSCATLGVEVALLPNTRCSHGSDSSLRSSWSRVLLSHFRRVLCAPDGGLASAALGRFRTRPRTCCPCDS